MKYELIFASNVDENRVEAEITCKYWYKTNWEDVAIIYKRKGEFVVERCEKFNESKEVSELVEAARSGLENYINAEGIELEEGITRAAAALKLQLKKI